MGDCMVDDARTLGMRMHDLQVLADAARLSTDEAVRRHVQEIDSFLRQARRWIQEGNAQATALLQTMKEQHSAHLLELLLERTRVEEAVRPEYVEPTVVPAERGLAMFLGDKLRLSPGTLANALLVRLVQEEGRPLRVRAIARATGKSAAAVSKAFHELCERLSSANVGYTIRSERTGERTGFRLEKVA